MGACSQIEASFTLINLLFPDEQQLVPFLEYNFVVLPVKACPCVYIRLAGFGRANNTLMRPLYCSLFHDSFITGRSGRCRSVLARSVTDNNSGPKFSILSDFNGPKAQMNLTRVTLNVRDTLLL